MNDDGYMPDDWKKSSQRYFQPKKPTNRIPFGLGLVIILVVAPLIIWLISKLNGPTGMVFAGVSGICAIILMIVIGAGLMFLPIIVAVKRNHRQTLGIVILTVFFGWTLVGWVAALIWATWASAADRSPYDRPRNRTEAGE